jgi:hypothetical protein
MILFVESLIDGKTRKYPFNSSEDVERFMKAYPNLDHLRSITHDIKELAANICEVLSEHHMNAWSEASEHFVDPSGDPWSEHKYNRGGEKDFLDWIERYHKNNK